MKSRDNSMHVTTGEVIRRIRKSLGMTQAELGAILGYTQPVISQLEHDGAAIHDVRVLRRIAKALHVPLAILVVESDEEADVNRRNFLRASALGAGTAVAAGATGQAATASSTASVHVGTAEVAEITASTNEIHELDLLAGGDRLCRLAANEVRYVKQLLDNGTYTDAVGQTLTSAAAEMMTAAGWVNFDAGRLDQARRYYAEAAQTATAANDGIAASHALLNASMQSFQGGFGPSKPSKKARPVDGVNLADAAQHAARRDGGPRLRAVGAIYEAGAHSAMGNSSAMMNAISRAHRAYESGRGHDPNWVYLPPAALAGMTGWSYMRIGDHHTAAVYLQEAIDGTASWPRENAGWRIKLAENHIQGGDIADGCQLLIDDFEQISGMTSTRLRATIRSITQEVQPHRAVPEVREFLGLVGSNSPPTTITVPL
ncbi:helix-turn-helix domain-containing protein [Nocardia jiangxiensis]|uniref:helix-turn-helix domain-containing protein n=1 Tax=Nocardia jiangxiensis TaxID=282685 RepID=UPI00146D604A|nr:helix-turn-helix transcriptional regulator [Nocardia jiangxiensis]